ncbi:MAG TPA: alpha/beta hydrolase-fold protein [Mycobacteriales bacterium]|nr:alpha/beta hydrolase-fold protein [Mycobacteriales bacterium]
MTDVSWNFSITSYWFIGAVAALTVALGLGTVVSWEWPRLRLARRTLGIFLTQAMVTATLAAVVNAQADFYSSSGELVAAFSGGSAPAPPVTVPTTYVGMIAADQRGPQPWDRQQQPHRHGLLVETAIRGRRTGYDLPADIYLPSAYFNQHQRTRRFPVVELTDGYPGSPHVWLHALHLVDVLNHLIATHRIAPMIAVLPTQDPVAGRDSECVDAVGGARAGTYLGQDVPDTVARQFRTIPTRAGWAILGYSTGGFCAVNTALRYSGQFSAAASLSGYFRPLTDITTGDLYRNDAPVRSSDTPMLSVRRRHQPLRFYLFGSRQDHQEVALDRAFAAQVRRPDRATQAIAATGGHNFQTWDRALPSALEWIGRALHPVSSKPA